MNSLKKWRTINKVTTLMKDGVNHHWCGHHVYEGRYDGLYYHNHTEATHEEWAAKKRGGQAENTTGSAPAAPTPSVGPNLMIYESLRNAMCTNFCISKEDLAKVVQKLVHRAFLRESEIIRLGPTDGVGAAGDELVVLDARTPRFFAAYSSCVASV